MQSRHVSWASPIFLAFAIVLSVPVIAQTPWPSKPIPPGALETPPSILPDASNLDAVDIKIHAQLRDALDAKARGVAASSMTHLPAALHRNDQFLVEVHFRDDESATDAIDVLQRHGATLRNRLSDAMHEVWIPIDRLRELAAEADVAYVIPARLARPVIGSKISQGVAAGNADYWQTFVPAYDGTGIKIAMVDAYQQSTIASLQTSKDWPPAGKLTCFDLKGTAVANTNPPFNGVNCTSSTFGSGNVQHGNATLEIAYDVAPGASFLAYDTETVGDWRNAILDAAHLNASGASIGAVKANVISASLAAPLDGKGDGTALPGSIAEAAGFAKTHGVLVVNAAGNERENHWGGLYAPSSGASAFHTWSGSNTIYNPFGDGAGHAYCVSDGAVIDVEMYWNNWTSPGSTHNYDVYLYQDISTNGTPNWLSVDNSTNAQNGGIGQTPQEIIQYTASGGATGGCPAHSAAYAIAVVRVAGTTATDNLQVFASTSEGQPLNFDVTSRSLTFPADSPNVLSVAAIDVANATKNPQEPFSSEGPVLGAGGALPTNTNPATDPNLKPDLASFDHVTTVTLGVSAFYGTSASTPHAAGMAALFMQKFGIQTTSTALTSAIITPLRAISLTGSNDLGTIGKDYQYGYGRLRFQKDASLYFLQQPSNTAVNAAIIPPVKIGVLDTEGKPDIYTLYTGANLAIGNNPGGAVLSGGGAALFVQGVATYSALKINQGGTGYTLSATSTPTGLVATSNAFNITTGAAAKLAFTVQPSNVVAGHVVAPTVQVSVEDANGNLVTTGSYQIALKKTACSTTAPDGGGPIATINGVASFPALTFYTVANGVVLQATASGLSTATSGAFNVTANTDILFANGFETCQP